MRSPEIGRRWGGGTQALAECGVADEVGKAADFEGEVLRLVGEAATSRSRAIMPKSTISGRVTPFESR
jgi:hypothetical protein